MLEALEKLKGVAVEPFKRCLSEDPELQDLFEFYRSHWVKRPKKQKEAAEAEISSAPQPDAEPVEEDEGGEEEECEEDAYVELGGEDDADFEGIPDEELGVRLGVVAPPIPKAHEEPSKLGPDGAVKDFAKPPQTEPPASKDLAKPPQTEPPAAKDLAKPPQTELPAAKDLATEPPSAEDLAKPPQTELPAAKDLAKPPQTKPQRLIFATAPCPT